MFKGAYYDDDVKSAVIPVCLPWNENDIGRKLTDGANLTVTGWGRSTNNEIENQINLAKFSVPTAHLQKLDVPLVSSVECLKVQIYKERLQLNFDLQFCAGGVRLLLGKVVVPVPIPASRPQIVFGVGAC